MFYYTVITFLWQRLFKGLDGEEKKVKLDKQVSSYKNKQAHVHKSAHGLKLTSSNKAENQFEKTLWIVKHLAVKSKLF